MNHRQSDESVQTAMNLSHLLVPRSVYTSRAIAALANLGICYTADADIRAGSSINQTIITFGDIEFLAFYQQIIAYRYVDSDDAFVLQREGLPSPALVAQTAFAPDGIELPYEEFRNSSQDVFTNW